jgi:NAD(P)-dependent dehydrogenase (short-subunit alcohol dehydrogenase family)
VPRVWVLSAGDSPIGISLARQLLAHGDYVVIGVGRSDPERNEPRSADLNTFLAEVDENNDLGWRERLRTVVLDIRYVFVCPFWGNGLSNLLCWPPLV